jgi:hypothetical protein
MSESDDKKAEGGAEVVPIEEARKRAEEKAAAEAAPPPSDPASNVLEPVMAAIARQLAQLADPEGNINLSGDEAQKAKTAAVVKGLGEGLGVVLAQVFSKWADKIDIKLTPAPPDEPAAPAATDEKPTEPTPPPATPGKPEN